MIAAIMALTRIYETDPQPLSYHAILRMNLEIGTRLCMLKTRLQRVDEYPYMNSIEQRPS
jgi:hypothetical protein